MNREVGVRESKIWLIGDSEPSNNIDSLQYPFDLKHPTVYNIVIPVLEQVQDDVFAIGNRIDWNKLYIRNAVEKADDWENESILNEEVANFRNIIEENSPIIIMSFGTRAFEFTRRALGEQKKGLKRWSAYKLGKEFARRSQEFNVNKTNLIPLLHACICRGRFLEAHRNFCTAINEANIIDEENYFIATGKLISPILINNKSNFNCWKVSV